MRLICPNCDAQYEVDANLIPIEGRDVQCSDCGHVWYQYPEGFDLDDDPDAAEGWPGSVAEPASDPVAAMPDDPESAPDPGEVPAEVALADVTEAPFATDDDDGDPDDDATPDPGILRRHTMDETLVAVLREEAERETRARAAEAARAAGRGIESQPELGLPEAEEPPRLRIRPRAIPADETETSPDVAAALASPEARPSRPQRRDLLPDIEEINSTLRATGSARKGATAETSLPDLPEPRRKGFRAGFLGVLAVAVLGAVLYSQAPRITAAVPAAAPVLDGWVAGVDNGRRALDRLAKSLLERMRGDG